MSNKHDFERSAAWEITRIFSGITVGPQGPSVRRSIRQKEEPFFLRQSSIDCSCGPSSLFMALIALGVFEREMLTRDGVSPTKVVQMMWRQAKKYHFVGTGLQSLRKIVRPVAAHIEWRVLNGVNRNVKEFVLKRLQEGKLVILGLENARQSYYHWALVVGVDGWEEQGSFRARRFLLVDPNLDEPLHTPWNNTICVDAMHPHGRLRQMRSVSGAQRLAALNGAIAIGWRQQKS
jgi:hypothetical protein